MINKSKKEDLFRLIIFDERNHWIFFQRSFFEEKRFVSAEGQDVFATE